MEFKRTPDERFQNLEGYSFEPNYISVDDTEGGQLRMHYLDEGDASGDIVLLLHGQPVWSYLYRYMIPLLADAGFRVIAPDLIGFGRSDKPTKPEDYTYARHVAWVSEFVTQLDLSDVTVFFQDWGSLIGLRVLAALPDRFAHAVLANGSLPAGRVPDEFAEPMREAYKAMEVPKARELDARFRDSSGIPGILYWRKFCAQSPELIEIGRLISGMGKAKPLSAGEQSAFNAPYPDDTYLSGPRRFPSLIPIFEDEPEVAENREAWKTLEQFTKPFMLAFSDDDPVTAGADKVFMKRVPGCKGVEHRTIGPAGHFLQHDQPEQCVKAILDVIGTK